MIALTPEAGAQVRALERFYIDEYCPQALQDLRHAPAEANLIIIMRLSPGFGRIQPLATLRLS